jgi:molybdate-binding protein/DNA-binding transcriptional regulator YhcF (GntR family)
MGAKFQSIHLNPNSTKPIYQQISEQIQLLIVSGQILTGESLPSVRQLGATLNINPNTVARAYVELERERLVVAKRGGGTIVTFKTNDPDIRAVRQNHLFESINSYVIQMLSLGYLPEELEAAFYTVIERWREEQRAQREASAGSSAEKEGIKTIRIVGSHDMALNMLVMIHKQRAKDIEIEISSAGSVGGLIALEEGKADLAGTHLLDEETGEYNLPFIKRILPGREVMLINLVYRIQGLMVTAGNPKQIKGLEDLRRDDVTFINRQTGSGTRVLLDMHLKRLSIPVGNIKGYDTELDSHLTVGSAIAQGKASVGLGIEAAARACGLDFIPLFRERYDLATTKQTYQSEKLKLLLEIIKSDEFKNIINKTEGYDTSQTGITTLVS